MRKIWIALSLFLLSACTVGPDYVRPTAPAPARWTVAYQAAADLANAEWWRQFGDPVLDNLIETAVRENLDLKVAAARVDQFLGALDTTRSQYFPQISAAYTGIRQRQAEMPNESHQATVNASWELDLWGRIRRANEASQAQIVGSEAGRRGVLLTLTANVASGYLTLRGLDRQLEVTRATEKAYAESLKLFRLRFEYGTVSQLEVAQAESQYEAARQSIPAYESLIRQQENLIQLLLGRPPGPIPRGKGLDELTAPGIPAGLPSELLERRPDILQAEQALIAANAQIGVAKAAYFPRISLTGALGVASADIGRLVAPGTDIWSAGGQIAAPLFSFGGLSGQVKQAEAQEQQALFLYRQSILTGFREVEDALVKATKGREQLEAQERQVRALEEYARLSRLQFEAGTSSYLQVLDADRSLFSGRLAFNQTRFDLLTAIVSVYKSMGGGWVAEAEKLGPPGTSWPANYQ
ncbi:MAG: efflux transporter outer membrane subunit [Deltaproteobacteria bacterium]|nr:efflux transporter outer membrane subunit [Deltaproteobacteria bacterium]